VYIGVTGAEAEDERVDPSVMARPLLARVASSDLSVDFEDFFAGHYRSVVRLGVALAGRADIGEELAQEAFIRAFKHWERIGTYDDAGAWVRRVLVNLATSSFRRSASEARALARWWSRHEREATRPEPIDDSFLAVLRRLPRRQAQCLALHYLEDLPVGEVSRILQIAEPTVRVHLRRGRSALTDDLGLSVEGSR